MAMKTIPNFIDYIKFDEVEVGAVIKGFFKEWRPSDKKGYQPTIILEALDGETLYGMAATKLTRTFVGDKEQNISPQILPGWYVEVKYLGSKEIASGDYKGGNAHQFEISYDEERIHPVFGGTASAREHVEYKNSSANEAPPLAKPEPASADPNDSSGATPAQTTPAATTATAAAPATTPASASSSPKRSVFG